MVTKHHSAEDKIRIVLEGLRGEESIAVDLPLSYPSGEPHLPFQVKPLSSVLMDDLKVAHKYGGQ